MEIRKRSTKAVAARHDLNYFKRSSPLQQWQRRLTIGAIAASIIWLAAVALTHGRELFSKGPISAQHAIFGAKCEACHVDSHSGLLQSAGFRRHVPDAACQSCHQVPGHQPKATLALFSQPDCASCHVEHVGAMVLANIADKGCTTCHADLKSSHYASNIHSFIDGHPQFAPLRSGYQDDQQIKFNHQAHLQRDLKGPQGAVTLSCADCHRTPAVQRLTPWRFGATPQLRQASLNLDVPNAAPYANTAEQNPLHPTDNRAYMAESTYAENCSSCHTLQFDKHIAEGAPHATPSEVRQFIREKLQAYAIANPQIVTAEIANWANDPMAKAPQYRLIPPPHNQDEWVAIRSRQAERRIWYQSCNLCHAMKIPNDAPTPVAAAARSVQSDALATQALAAHTMTVATPIQDSVTLPSVAPTNQKTRRLTNAVFSHQSHIAVSCESCHTRTRTSNQGDDILLPGIASCQKCHDGKSSPQGPALASGHAEGGCFLCHQYHDWNHPQTNPVTPRNLDFKEIGELQPPR